MIKTILARKEKPGEFCGQKKEYPIQAALNLLAEGYTIYSKDGKNRVSWKDIQDVLDGIKEINFRMEVIK